MRKTMMASTNSGDAAAAVNESPVPAPPAPSSLGVRHAQGGDVLIPASANWCESRALRGPVLKAASVIKQSQIG